MDKKSRKFSELILYIAKKSEKDPNFGAVKLNKLLFYSDFIAFGSMGASITGQKYRKKPYGPVPFDIETVKQLMITNSECAIQEREHFGRTQHRLLALREPDLECFTGSEIALVNDVIERCKNLNATDISEQSHDFIGWESAFLDEEIPYETVFISNRSLTENEIEYGLNL